MKADPPSIPNNDGFDADEFVSEGGTSDVVKKHVNE